MTLDRMFKVGDVVKSIRHEPWLTESNDKMWAVEEGELFVVGNRCDLDSHAYTELLHISTKKVKIYDTSDVWRDPDFFLAKVEE